MLGKSVPQRVLLTSVAMLQDFPARALHYDATTDVARLVVGDAGGQTRTLSALLLLDAKGFLVGVDLGGEALERAVVLLGPYESVDRTVPAEVEVVYGTAGEPVEVRIGAAKGKVRAGDASPYVKKP
jgi:hypothetical protein